MKRISLCVAIVAALSGLVQPLPVAAMDATAADIELGRRLYIEGQRADGTPLVGTRWDNVQVSGEQAACVLCHRRSGMGEVESNIQVSPVTGPALFGADKPVLAQMDPSSGKAFNRAHAAYTDVTLTTAMREGKRVDGERMLAMMPRYALSDAEMRALNGYLRQLSVNWSPGVSRERVRLATVVTPDVSEPRRKAFSDQVKRMVHVWNSRIPDANVRSGRRHMSQAAEFVLGTQRKIEFEIWSLSGPAETWGAQLEARYKENPVFALASGLGRYNWAPVQTFCETNQVPCWFASVDSPPPQTPFFSFYFQRGLQLESEVLARHLDGLPVRPGRVIQVRRDDAATREASAALALALKEHGIASQERILGGATGALAELLHDLNGPDAVMLWLGAEDLAALPAMPAQAGFYVSGRLGAVDTARLAAGWRERLRVIYPYELPDQRKGNLAFFKAWMQANNLPLIDDVMQSEVYFAMNFMFETTTEMLDNLYRDYLIERAENMISKRERVHVEEELQKAQRRRIEPTPAELANPDTSPWLLVHRAGLERGGTTIYPRLNLGPDQRYASKGAYIVRFDQNGKVVAESDWIVP